MRNLGNPISNALTLIAGGLALFAAFSFGLVLLTVFAVALVILISIVSVRVWWFRRKMAKQYGAQQSGPFSGPAGDAGRKRGTTIESEYEVIDDQKR